MLIDLLEQSNSLLNEYGAKTQFGKVRSKGFTSTVSAEQINSLRVNDAYKQHIIELLNLVEKNNKKGNIVRYPSFCSGYTDQYFDLEVLGIECYAQQYSIVADLSDKLDYVLHRLSGCTTAEVRQIPNYEQLSKAILSVDTNSSFDISVLLDVSPKLTNWLNSIYNAAVAKDNSNSLQYNFFCSLFQEIQYELNTLKVNIFHQLKRLGGEGVIVRSYSYTSIVSTSAQPFNATFEFTQDGYENCIVEIKSYEKFQYAEENYPLEVANN